MIRVGRKNTGLGVLNFESATPPAPKIGYITKCVRGRSVSQVKTNPQNIPTERWSAIFYAKTTHKGVRIYGRNVPSIGVRPRAKWGAIVAILIHVDE